jgi:L-iditol 2-dehydrogenase
MLAARLHGPSDLRVEETDPPDAPGDREVLLRVRVTGICGSDLHSYLDARIGDTPVVAPLILGHEFAAVIEAAGAGALDGNFEPPRPGQRVAVDPAQPCGRCEMCEQGHPNLCWHLHFCGNYPYGGSLCELMLMPARSCFPVPETLTDVEAALLEPLGVALHTVDLARIRVGNSLAIIGAGPIGLLVLQVARLAGADPVFVVDPLEWRLDKARALGGIPVAGKGELASAAVQRETRGRGVDVAIEAAWADTSVEDAAEMARLGGRVILVGIPGDDRLALRHSTARRKGLTLRLCRRMKHVYPRAIRLAMDRRVDLGGLVSHDFGLTEAVEAFRLNAAYADQVLKVMIHSGGRVPGK